MYGGRCLAPRRYGRAPGLCSAMIIDASRKSSRCKKAQLPPLWKPGDSTGARVGNPSSCLFFVCPQAPVEKAWYLLYPLWEGVQGFSSARSSSPRMGGDPHEELCTPQTPTIYFIHDCFFFFPEACLSRQ